MTTTNHPAPVSVAQDLFDPHALECELRGDVPWPLPWRHPVVRLEGIAVEFDARTGEILRAAVDDGFLFLAEHRRPCTDARAEQIAADKWGPCVFEASGQEFYAAAHEWLDERRV